MSRPIGWVATITCGTDEDPQVEHEKASTAGNWPGRGGPLERTKPAEAVWCGPWEIRGGDARHGILWRRPWAHTKETP